MKSRTFKKLTALIVAVMLVLSMCITGISASAAVVSDGTTVLYLKPNSNWMVSTPRFAIYMFDGATKNWVDMADEDGDGYYSATIPEGTWGKVIFCRMSGSTTENNWDNRWNQTADLVVPDGVNCYTVKSGTWDKGGGDWSVYTPEVPTEPVTEPTDVTEPDTEPTEPGTEPTEPATEPDTEPAEGDYYLFGYINGANYGCEEDFENLGEYKFVDGSLVAKFDSDSYVGVKTTGNANWYMTDGWLGNVTDATLYNTAVLGETANKLMVPGGVEVTFTLVDNGDDTYTLSYVAEEAPTEDTEPATEPETEVTEPAGVDYYLFGFINGANYGCEEDFENLGEYKFVDGTLTATFDEAGYVGVKTADNANWYMTDGWAGIVTEVTLYNTADLGVDADKLMVPAGEVTFTLVENEDGTLTLSYTADELPTIPEPETTEPETEVTEPAGVDYYLFGFINGANYGCEEDFENLGEYKFVDGTLTATFDEAGYVGVKTADNANWYMTDGWAGIVTEVTLYNTADLGVDADKLMVPAGEVTFTLVENEDGTLTLSYTADELPTIPEPETTEPETEEPTTAEPTTAEPTTAPVGDVTLKFAAPTSYAARYNWSEPVLYYGNAQSIESATKLAMTATDEVYYTTDAGTSTLLTTNGWQVYTLTLTAEQAAEVNAAKFVGFATADGVNRTQLISGANVLKAGVDEYTAAYAATATAINELNGSTFVIKDSYYGATDCVSYKGYWVTDYVTVKTAAPLSATTYSYWNSVDMYYGDTLVFADMTKITMINTGETVKTTSVGASKSIKTGRWYIYALTLDAATAAKIENAAYAGFCKTDAENRTNIRSNVLNAKTNAYDGEYNAESRSLKELEGQVFVIKDTLSATNPSSVATYAGEWETEEVYTQGKDDTITVYFAAPKGIKAYANWDTGVELYYGTTAIYTETERLAMTKTDKTVKVKVDGTNLTTLANGDWDVYSLTLTVDQIKAIDNSKNAGFVKAGSFNRTSILSYRNICKASKLEGETAYNGVQESIETYDGYMFVINGHYPTSDENVSFTGSWVVA